MLTMMKNSKNTNAAYQYINYRLSESVQKKVANTKSLNNAPVNQQVNLSKKEAANKTYGDVAKRAKTIDFFYVNSHISKWINQWNKIMNN